VNKNDLVFREPETHQLALRIARRCVFIVQACLREEEVLVAVREFYEVAVAEISKRKSSGVKRRARRRRL
jgi:hypothetical protein